MTSKHIQNPPCITIYDIDGYFLDDATLKEMNNYLLQQKITACFEYPRIGGGAEEIYRQLIAIGVDFIVGIGVNVLYDILKYTFSLIANKTKHMKEKPTLFIECNEQFLKIDYGFELTDEQKDKVIDESLKFIRQNNNSLS